MKFSIVQLLAFTTVVAVYCVAVKFFGSSVIRPTVLMAFLFAPCVLALLLAPFKVLSPTARRRIAFGLLLVLGTTTVVLCSIPNTAFSGTPLFGAVVAAVIGSLWMLQGTALMPLYAATNSESAELRFSISQKILLVSTLLMGIFFVGWAAYLYGNVRSKAANHPERKMGATIWLSVPKVMDGYFTIMQYDKGATNVSNNGPALDDNKREVFYDISQAKPWRGTISYSPRREGARFTFSIVSITPAQPWTSLVPYAIVFVPFGLDRAMALYGLLLIVTAQLTWKLKPKPQQSTTEKYAIPRVLIPALILLLIFAPLAGSYYVWMTAGYQETIVPVEQAYSTNFSVIALDGEKILRAGLTDAIEAIEKSSSVTAYLAKDQLEELQNRINQELQGSSKAEIKIESISEAVQVVTLSYDYGSLKQTYCYEVSEDAIRPLWSSRSSYPDTKRLIYQ